MRKSDGTDYTTEKSSVFWRFLRAKFIILITIAQLQCLATPTLRVTLKKSNFWFEKVNSEY